MGSRACLWNGIPVLVVVLSAGTLGLADGPPDASRACSTDATALATSGRSACETLDACISALVAAAEPGPGISAKGQAASKAVLAYGEAAVPALLPLLRDEDAAVRDLASFTLRDAPVSEEHLDALMASRQRGDGWIPPAIARIGSPRAIEFLVSELQREPESRTQLTWAFRLLGAKGVPHLVRLFDCDPHCDQRVLDVAAYVFSELGDGARGAIEPLLAIAEDSGKDPRSRCGAIRALGSVGSSAAPAVSRLEALAARDPDAFDECVAEAMIRVGGATAIEGRRVEARAQARCRTEGTAEAERSRVALQNLDERVRGLESIAAMSRVVADLRSLLGSRCFRRATEHGEPPEFAHPLSLRTWWESGGMAWLASYIDPPRLGRVDDLREHVVFPPRPRKVLALDTAPDHSLAPLLCRLADETCGLETRGWAERAREAFTAAVVRDRTHEEDGLPVNDAALAARCEDEAARDGALASYAAWMECLAEHRLPGWSLPLGRFRAPSEGWLVIRGRRGHYEFCDQLGAYDLETGAAYVAKSCSGLHLRTGGSVDFEATNSARKIAVEVGRVDVANLREAVWMMLLAPETEELFLSADYYPIPKGVVPTLPSPEGKSVSGGSMRWNSGQTLLNWSWLATGGQVKASGPLTWPSSYAAPEAHAADLLRIFELGLRPGCPPAGLPSLAAGTPPAGVSSIDARPGDVTSVQGELAKRLRDLTPAAATCDADDREGPPRSGPTAR